MKELLSTLPSIPRDDNDQPVFGEPWQAAVFAMVLRLHEQQVFTWTEWAACLSEEIAENQAATCNAESTEAAYYHCWLRSLERLLVEKSVGTRRQLDSLYQSWHGMAESTPHGQPVTLLEEHLRIAGLKS